jgi:mono/diheme cytochrome c family protein
MKFAKHVVLGVALVLGVVIWFDAAHPPSLAAVNSISSQKGRTAAAIYNNQCASCHGKDGSRTLRGKIIGATDLSSANWQERTSDEHIFNTISNGHGKMPAFGKKLSQSEIESLVAYVRRLKK